MKYSVISFFKWIIAALLAFFTSVFSSPKQTEVPVREPLTVGVYDIAEADCALTIDPDEMTGAVSDLLYGAFFEDINFSADGGLYAELVSNRSFEYGDLARGDGLYGYTPVNGARLTVVDGGENALNENNPHYCLLSNDSDEPAGLENAGFLEGMSLRPVAYRFSVYARSSDSQPGTLTVRLRSSGDVLAEAVTPQLSGEWTKYELELRCTAEAGEDAALQLLTGHGEVSVDMISLFPVDTFKGRENGLRSDLADAIAALRPKFLRFPGGCVIEGYDKNTAYSWKDSVGADKYGQPLLFNGRYGDVAARRQGVNIWTDLAATDDPYPGYMSYGLGFYEFFQFAEDIGASPVPVLNCGLYCQMRGMSGEDMNSALFDSFLGDMLDLVEFCRGGADTKWGAVRADMGHEAPFEIRYIGIGNENEGEDYFVRYKVFLDAFNAAKEADPELFNGISLIYSAGASDALSGENHAAAYDYAASVINGGDALDFAGAIDEHYYQTPEWFLKNADYYDPDNYRRDVSDMTRTVYGGAIPVFLGEYAARSNTLRAALAEAAYMTGLERNGDIVRMAAYAPLLASHTASHWSPDLIWFDNSTVSPSVNYYVQQLFSENQTACNIRCAIEGAGIDQPALSGRVGLGTWDTDAEFDDLTVTDNASGKKLISESFTLPCLFWDSQSVNDSVFKTKGGKLISLGEGAPYSQTGNVRYFGADDDMRDYTLTVKATKTGGSEGFLIPFAVMDKDDNYFWNIGGWGNTVSCLQKIDNGEKSGKILKTVSDFTVETGSEYELKVEVSGTRVRCFADDELLIDYDTASPAEARCYSCAGIDENGDLIIKLVNPTCEELTTSISIAGSTSPRAASLSVLAGSSPDDENEFGKEPAVSVERRDVELPGGDFNIVLPKLSVTVIKL